MTAELAKLVDTIGHAMLQIRDMFTTPDDVAFMDVYESMEKLEGFIEAKALIDASFAHICDRDGAGRLVGSPHASSYLKQSLGCTPREAFDRLARGRDLFGEPPVDEPVPDPAAGDDAGLFDTSTGAGPSTDADAAADAAAAREQARKDQEEARKHAAAVNTAKQEAIRQELDRLVDAAAPQRPRLLAQAMKEAPDRDVTDLRRLVRKWVDIENRKARRENPNAGMEHRALHEGKRRSDGNYDVHAVLTPDGMALLKALLDKGMAPNMNLPKGVEEYRTPAQRRYDQLMRILRHVEHCEKQTSEDGCASVVVAVTLDDLADADAETLFHTNTGVELGPFDLVRLGLDGVPDFVLTIDGLQTRPLHLGRGARIASIGQRITLLAMQGVCAWAGCNAPLTECEAHHVVSWLRGGNTDIDNLAGLCRHHHRHNNDFWDHKGNTSHIEPDPVSGKMGVRRMPDAPLEFNTSTGAMESAANRLKHINRRRATDTDPPPGQDPNPPF